MNTLSVSDKCRVAIAWLLVKFGRLHYDDFSKEELNSVIEDYFPQLLEIDIPIGNATLNCKQGSVKLIKGTHRVSLVIPQEFKIEVLANPIYRAHVITHISAKPYFDKRQSSIRFTEVSLDNIEWVNDEYSLVQDTSALLQQLSVVSLTNTLTSPFKRLLSTVTGGLPQSSLNYLQSFTQDNKQRILTNHKPALEKAILAKLETQTLSVELDDTIWRHYLFSRIGTRITVEENQLRFWLS